MPVSPFPSPKSSLALRRNAPPPLHVPCSPLLFSPPIPQDNTVPRSTSQQQRVDRSWSIASIPIFLDQGDDLNDQGGDDDGGGTNERAQHDPQRCLALDDFALDKSTTAPSDRSAASHRSSKVLLFPEDVDHADTAYSAAPVPSPRRALRSLARSPVNNTPVRREGGPLTPGDEEPGALMLARRQSVASSADSSSMGGSSTGTMMGLGMRRDESEGAISLAGTFGQKRSSFVAYADDDVEGEQEEEDHRYLSSGKQEADRVSLFSLSEYYGRDDSASGQGKADGDLDHDDWHAGRAIDPPPKSPIDPDDPRLSLDLPRLAPSASSKTVVPHSASPSPNSSPPRPPRSPPKMLPRSKSPPPPLTTLPARASDPNLPDFLRTAPSSPATPSPSPARSDLSASARYAGLPPPPHSASSAKSESASHMTPDWKRAGGHRVSSSYSSPRNSRASMFVQQGKDISIDLWIDQEGFRAIRPRLSFTRYSPPNPYPSSAGSGSGASTPQKQQPGHQRARSTSFGSGSPTRNSTEIAAATGFFEFGMKKRQSWAFHHAVLDKSPVLRRLTLSEDDTKDFLSRQGDLVVKTNGVYTLKGAEDKGLLEWKFEYEVDDRVSPAGKIITGEKVLTPISFSCAPDLLAPSRGRKPNFLSVVKKTVVLPNLVSEKLELLTANLPPTPPPGNSLSSSPLGASSTTSLPLGGSGARPSTTSGSRPSTSSGARPSTSSSRPSTPQGAMGSRPTTPAASSASRKRQASYGAYLSTPTASPTPQTAPLPTLPTSTKPTPARKRSASLSSRLARPFTPPSTSSVPLPTVPLPFISGRGLSSASGSTTPIFGARTTNPSSSTSRAASSGAGTHTPVHPFGTTRPVVLVSPLPFIPPDHPPPAQPGQPWAGVPMSLGVTVAAGAGRKGVLKSGGIRGKGRPATADPAVQGRRW